jgi:protoheme ferro-lyase
LIAYPQLIVWTAVIILSVSLGASIVLYLVAPPLRMAACALLSAFLAAGLALVVWAGLDGGARLLAVGVAIAASLAGYLPATWRFLHQEEQRSLPALDPPPPERRDHAAVIYFTHGEPPAYSPLPWIETFKELDGDRVSFIPWPFRPLFFRKFRAAYLKAGGSPHNYLHRSMAGRLREAFRAEGDETTRFYMAFLDSNPRPDESAIRAVNDGANKIAFATVFVTVSSHTKAGQDMLAALNLERYGVPVAFADPLWDSQTLHGMFVDRVNRYLEGTDKSNVGILLVGHGQPPDWDRTYPTQTEQELLFRQQIVERLVADGYTRENLALAWMEFKQPKVAEIARELAGRGIEKLFVFATSISASSLHSLYDIPHAVVEAGLPRAVEVVNLGAWDDDPIAIRAIKEQVEKLQ